MSLSIREIEALETLGEFFLRHERIDEACAVFEGLTTLAPDRAYAWYGLARAAEHRGQRDRAAELYAACTVRDDRPTYRLSQATCLLLARRPTQAATALRAIEPSAPPEIRQRARALLAALGGFDP